MVKSDRSPGACRPEKACAPFVFRQEWSLLNSFANRPYVISAVTQHQRDKRLSWVSVNSTFSPHDGLSLFLCLSLSAMNGVQEVGFRSTVGQESRTCFSVTWFDELWTDFCIFASSQFSRYL